MRSTTPTALRRFISKLSNDVPEMIVPARPPDELPHRRLRGRAGWRWLAMLACLLPAFLLHAEPSREYQIKAAFLFNFAQFVEWPESGFADATASFSICVLGEDPFGSFLDVLVQNEKVRGRAVRVRRSAQIDGIDDCQILFVGHAQARQWRSIADRINGRSVLTVVDGNDVERDAGIIRFATNSGKIRLVVNVDRARASKLQISSKLLRAAEIVGAGKAPS